MINKKRAIGFNLTQRNIRNSRIGKLGYITDMLTMPDESFEQLQGIEVLVMNALRIAPHNTNQSLSEALEAVKRIGAKETWLIHMSHHIGLQADVEKQLPPHVHFAFVRSFMAFVVYRLSAKIIISPNKTKYTSGRCREATSSSCAFCIRRA